MSTKTAHESMSDAHADYIAWQLARKEPPAQQPVHEVRVPANFFQKWARKISNYRRQIKQLQKSLALAKLRVQLLENQVKIERNVNELDRGMRILKKEAG